MTKIPRAIAFDSISDIYVLLISKKRDVEARLIGTERRVSAFSFYRASLRDTLRAYFNRFIRSALLFDRIQDRFPALPERALMSKRTDEIFKLYTYGDEENDKATYEGG